MLDITTWTSFPYIILAYIKDDNYLGTVHDITFPIDII